MWQDFIFSCSIYPLDDEAFLENVRIEAVQNIRRLRHRASLALWCGNNEMEWGWESWGWSESEIDEEIRSYAEKIPELRRLLWAIDHRELFPGW